MANNKEHITEKYVTGKGELTGFIAIIDPSTKFNKKGVYSLNILLNKEEGQELEQKLKDIRTEQFKAYGKGTKVAELPCKPYEIVDEETGEASIDPQGRYILKTNASAYIEGDKPKFRPAIFNAKKQPVKNLAIGEGTIARVAVTLSGYSVAGKTGVSAKLKAVQIIELVEYTGGFGADAFDEEDGFDGVGEDFKEETKPTVTTEEPEEEEDF